MQPVKIVIIGAGSATFGLNSLATLLREKTFQRSTLTLVDMNAEGLVLVHQLAEQMSRTWEAGVRIESTTDRREALAGANFVVCSIEVGPREELWRQDWEISLRHGLRQPYAENGGPGGFFHAVRNIPHILDIARDMEELCPQALLIMLSNPLPRLCRAVTKYTSIQTVGLCHGFVLGYFLLTGCFIERLGVPLPEIASDDHWGRTIWPYNDQIQEIIDFKAAGLNHFTWMLDVRDRRTGEDLYPELREKFLQRFADWEPFTYDLLRLTNYLPVQNDTHISEYVPYASFPLLRPWERYHIRLYNWDGAARGRNEMWEQIEGMVTGGPGMDRLRTVHSEGVYEVIHGVAHNTNLYRQAINVPNHGAITNLPDDTIVEVPAIISAAGVLPLRMGALPPVVAALCRREADLVELVVDAAVTGDRHLALQALALDPMVGDLDLARALLEDYLETEKEVLPQFHGRWSW